MPVDVFRRWADHWNRRDLDGGLQECIHPDVQWVPITAALEGTGYRGHEGVREWSEQLFRDWEVFDVLVEDVRELDEDRVLAIGSWRARGRGSGVELNQQAAWLARLRDGKMIYMKTFTDRAKALEAAGLGQ